MNPRLSEVSEAALLLTSVDFGISYLGGYRTPEEQNSLFLNKATNCDGYIKLSKHQSGNAIDVYAWVDGLGSFQMEHLAIIAAAHLQAGHELGIPIGWGGLWKSLVDGPHIYLLND